MRKLAHGFTLIELLVVVSIIGILATLIFANLNSARSRARDAQRKSDLNGLSTALRLYYNDNGTYPTSNNFFDSLWGQKWTNAAGTTVYMNIVPNDPSPGQSYRYIYDAASDTFTLNACLENVSDAKCDKDGSGNNIACWGGWAGCQYTVKP